MAALVPILIGLAWWDTRTLLGARLWLKPLKFALSFVAYAGTLAWMLGQLPARTLRRTGWVIVAASVIEMVIIGGQAARGVRSHFNVDDQLGTRLFEVMGGTVAVIYVATVVVGFRFLRTPGGNLAHATAIRLGLGLSVLGMSVGIIMSIIGSHAVGVPDGGPGLPLVGWSTTGGDLRIAHFVGLHGLQALPLLAAVLVGLASRATAVRVLDGPARTQIVGIAAAAYAAVVVGLTVQALRGQSLLHPDAAPLGEGAVLVLGGGVGLVGVLRAATRRSGDARPDPAAGIAADLPVPARSAGVAGAAHP